MSDGPKTRRTIENCPQAVEHLKQCCPGYDSYLSCTVFESWAGIATADLSSRESRCLRDADCGAIEKAVVRGKSLCGVSFRSQRCQ